MSDNLYRCQGGRVKEIPSSDDEIQLLLSKDRKTWLGQCFECAEKDSAFINGEKGIEMREYCIWEKVPAKTGDA